MDNQYKQNWDFTDDPWTAEMWGDWLRFYLMTGPDLPDLRKDYMELVGHPLRDAEGIGIILIEESYISRNLAEHTEMENRGYLARDCETCGATYLDSNPWWGKGGMLDWSNDAAGAYWHDWKREPLIDDGVIGHWTDLGEPEAYNDWAWYWGMPGDHKPLHQHGMVLGNSIYLPITLKLS